MDQLLLEEEHKEIRMHVHTCSHCTRIVEAFEEEQQFIKETLQTPALPNDFAALILEQMEPYERPSKRRSTIWKRALLLAAGVVLAVGVSAALNPSFAQFIGGMFATDQVDEGLQMAAEAGLAQKVGLAVTDQNITLQVEEMIVDASRVALSYKIVNQHGKALNPYIDWADTNNEIVALDQNGTPLTNIKGGWREDSDYGYTEFSIRDAESLEALTIQFQLVELNGVKGQWNLDVPVNLRQHHDLTTVTKFTDVQYIHHGVKVNIQKFQRTPSSTDLFYETALTDEEKARMYEATQRWTEQLGGASTTHLKDRFGVMLSYHLKNVEGEKVAYLSQQRHDQVSRADKGMIEGSGQYLEQLGHSMHIDSFIPHNEKMTFVLDGIYKTEPADFSITIRPNELKAKPVAFAYEGNELTIQRVKEKTEYALRKSMNPIQKEKNIVIELEGGKAPLSSELDSWVVVDDKGHVYEALGGGSILNETDEKGRFKTKQELTIIGMEEIPKELTLHLLTVTRYYPLETKWEVALDTE